MLTFSRNFIVYIIFIAFSALHGSRSEKPVIIKRPVSQNVYLNQSATFVCRVQSSLSFLIEWKNVDGKLLQSVPGSLLVVNDSLTFLHARRSDDGVYVCVAKNSAGRSSAQATLRVLDPPVAPTITEISPNQTIVERERVTIICKASGNPLPQITWKISLESGVDNVAQLERPSPQSIRISSASPSDSGQYLCIAENDFGNDTDAVYLKVLGYPVFIVSPPSTITVHENSTVSLNCKVIGSPTADVSWYYNDNLAADQISNIVILENNTLQISDVKFDNSGSYTCMANNSAGLQRSKSTLLKVFRAPKLECCSNELTVWKNQTAVEGRPISLHCSVRGHPEIEYEWMFKNKTISSLSVLRISNVSKSTEGVYSCKAHNILGEVSLIIYLSVLVSPMVSVEPEQATIVQGQRVEFRCTATGVPLPEIKWYSSRGLVLSNNTLVIVNVSRDDQGEYTCTAKNEAGRGIVTAMLVIAVRPTFLILPHNISVNETSSVNIECSAKGPDQPIISWYRLMMDGQKMNLNHSGNTLRISKVDRNESGFYVCEARNYAGCINTTFFINVQYRPYAIVSEQKVSIVAGKPEFLHCPITANPAAEIQWTNPVSFKGPRLTITQVNISHGGQYSCSGRNILGTINATIQVQVLTPPRIVDLNLTELHSNFVSLSCVTTGTPESVVHWIDLTPLPFGSFSVHHGRLQIEKRSINTMKFVCNASNVYGWTTKYVQVPSSPHNFNVTKTLSSSITFSWVANNTQIITSFVVERRTMLDWVTINSSVTASCFEDQDLPPFTTFMYRVSAKNVLGTSVPGGSFNASTQEGVPSTPSKLQAKSFSLTSITVYWKPPDELRGQLTNIMYEVYYEENTALPQSEVKITVNNTLKYQLRIERLKSNTLYILKIRAGRQADGSVRWSDYKLIRTRTLQKVPTAAPKEIKVVSNGPRRIYVAWKIPNSYVEGYKLQYKEYDSTNMTTIVIKSWNTSSYMITGLTANRYYEIQLNMFTSGGDGPWSRPKVVHTDQDQLALPGPIASSSDSLPWKIAVGGSVLAVVLLLLLLIYICLVRKSKHNEGPDFNKANKKSRKQEGYDFTDNASRVSNESEGSTKGQYNVNNDIDLSMFDNSHHTNIEAQYSNLYVENPILPAAQEDSDDSYEAVRLATFIARPSPQPTPYLTGRRQLSASHVNPAYHPDEDDDVAMYAKADKTRSGQPDYDIQVYAQVDFAAKERDKRARDNNTLEQLSDDILI